jgi:hypothetical protein
LKAEALDHTLWSKELPLERAMDLFKERLWNEWIVNMVEKMSANSQPVTSMTCMVHTEQLLDIDL